MKYSIILPYFNRLNLLENTYISYEKFYRNRDDWEVIIPIDSKCKEQINSVLELSNRFSFSGRIKVFVVDNTDCYCPPRLFNFGVEKSSGDYLILSNPEILHEVDILYGLDNEYNLDQNIYVMCSCRTDEEYSGWYQHSIYNNRLLHFCSSMSKKNYDTLNGFDEIYSQGTSYDDDDFKQKILRSDMRIVLRDDLISFHQQHSRSHIMNNLHLVQRNKEIYCKKWNFNISQINH